MTRIEALKALLIEKGFLVHDLENMASDLKPGELISYERVFDDRFQFVLRLGKQSGDHIGQYFSFGIDCGIRLNVVEELLDAYVAEVLKRPRQPKFLLITFMKQFFYTFEKEITYEEKIIDWIDNVINPVVSDTDKLFSHYWQCLKEYKNPNDFDGFNSDYMILRYLAVHFIDGDYSDRSLQELLSKKSLEMYLEYQPLVSYLEWLKKNFKLA